MPTCSQEIKLIAKKKRAKLMTARIVTIFHRREYEFKLVLCNMKEPHRVPLTLLPPVIMECWPPVLKARVNSQLASCRLMIATSMIRRQTVELT